MGLVVALHLKKSKGVCEPVDSLKAIDGYGFEGDYTAGRGNRQALLVSSSNLEEFGYSPGQLKEQITVDMPELQSLAPGSRLKIGSALIELTGDCAPCGGMARSLGEDESEFKAKTAGKRGMLARVVSDGLIKIGDSVELS